MEAEPSLLRSHSACINACRSLSIPWEGDQDVYNQTWTCSLWTSVSQPLWFLVQSPPPLVWESMPMSWHSLQLWLLLLHR